jgi:hypothetical protein
MGDEALRRCEHLHSDNKSDSMISQSGTKSNPFAAHVVLRIEQDPIDWNPFKAAATV